MNRRTAFALLLIVNVLGYCVLSFYQTTMAAAPGTVQMPFSNSVEQRLETVEQLKEIKELLKEQNALLRSGDVKVIVTELPKLTAARGAETPNN
jgi:hypothetical protein